MPEEFYRIITTIHIKNVKGNILSCSKHSAIIQRLESHPTDLPDKPFGPFDTADFLEKKKNLHAQTVLASFFFFPFLKINICAQLFYGLAWFKFL